MNPGSDRSKAEADLYRRIADSCSDWEYLEDAGGRVHWVSPSCEPLTGHAPDEFLNDPGLLERVVHSEDRALFASHRQACRHRDGGGAAEFRILRSDGAVCWIRHRCQPMTLPGGMSAGRRCSNHDITGLIEAERELLRLNRTLRALSNSSQAMTRADDESGFLAEVCRIIVEDCGHAMVWVGYAEEDEVKSVRPVAQAGYDQSYLDGLKISWADTERGRGPTGTAIRTGQPASCRNMLTDPRFAPWREDALKRGYASSIVLPLMAAGKAFGAINIYSREPDSFSEAESKLLSGLAAELSHGIAAIRLRAANAKAEETLRQSEERYRSLFENMLDGLAYCEMLFEDGRPRDFRYLAVNRAFETLTGLKDVVGKRATEAIPGIRESHPELIETYGRVALTGVPERFEIHFRPLEAWFSVSVYSNQKGYFAVVFDNITERRQAEDRLLELNETLEQRVVERTKEAEERTVQLKTLAAELSHAERRERQRLAVVLHDHLQQILVAAKFNLDTLKGHVREGGLQSLALRVDELLDESIAECRSLTVTLSPTVLQEAGLVAALGWLARRMEEQHHLKVAFDVGGGWAEPADVDVKALLFDATRELLFNVVKHSGVLEARIALQRVESHVEVRVEDRGKGLDWKAPLDPWHETAGVGLLFIQKRLDLIGGSMTVENAPGHGARVTLRAPAGPALEAAVADAVAPEGAAARDVARTAAAPARSDRIRVLLADDHRILRQALIALLRAEGGIDVVGEAADGAEAVELSRSLEPDVVLMDVSMPRLNGIDATRQIVAERPGARIIGLSMHEDETIAASMREAGAVDFVTKAGGPDALISAIHVACRPDSGGE